MQNLTQTQIEKHNENIRRQNAAKRATNKAYYYKAEITSLKQPFNFNISSKLYKFSILSLKKVTPSIGSMSMISIA